MRQLPLRLRYGSPEFIELAGYLETFDQGVAVIGEAVGEDPTTEEEKFGCVRDPMPKFV